MMNEYTSLINMYYPAGSARRDIYMRHCGSVARLALELNSHLGAPLDSDLVETAAMLHDIGIVMTDAPALDCHGVLPYICHGVAGADMIRHAGLDERYARVAERHTGSGLTDDEIASQSLPLPKGRIYMPQTTLERLICYADKFYSKSGDMTRLGRERVISMMSRHGQASLDRFIELDNEFRPRSGDVL